MAASAAFIQFARQARLIEGALVAIDGSKIRAMASKKALGRKVDLQRSHQAVTEEVTDYWSRLEKADQDEGGEATNRSAVQAALTRLQQRQGYLHDEIERIETAVRLCRYRVNRKRCP